MLPSEITKEDDPALQKPDESELQEHMEKTREILEKLTTSKISAAMPVKSAPKAVNYFSYFLYLVHDLCLLCFCIIIILNNLLMQ